MTCRHARPPADLCAHALTWTDPLDEQLELRSGAGCKVCVPAVRRLGVPRQQFALAPLLFRDLPPDSGLTSLSGKSAAAWQASRKIVRSTESPRNRIRASGTVSGQLPACKPSNLFCCSRMRADCGACDSCPNVLYVESCLSKAGTVCPNWHADRTDRSA